MGNHLAVSANLDVSQNAVYFWCSAVPRRFSKIVDRHERVGIDAGLHDKQKVVVNVLANDLMEKIDELCIGSKDLWSNLARFAEPKGHGRFLR